MEKVYLTSGTLRSSQDTIVYTYKFIWHQGNLPSTLRVNKGEATSGRANINVFLKELA